MKNQNQEIKNIGNTTTSITPKTENTVNINPIIEPVNNNPHSSELMNNILSTHNDPDSHPKQSLDFNFNIIQKDTFNSNLSSFANSIQKEPFLISTINNTQDTKIKPSIPSNYAEFNYYNRMKKRREKIKELCYNNFALPNVVMLTLTFDIQKSKEQNYTDLKKAHYEFKL